MATFPFETIFENPPAPILSPLSVEFIGEADGIALLNRMASELSRGVPISKLTRTVWRGAVLWHTDKAGFRLFGGLKLLVDRDQTLADGTRSVASAWSILDPATQHIFCLQQTFEAFANTQFHWSFKLRATLANDETRILASATLSSIPAAEQNKQHMVQFTRGTLAGRTEYRGEKIGLISASQAFTDLLVSELSA